MYQGDGNIRLLQNTVNIDLTIYNGEMELT